MLFFDGFADLTGSFNEAVTDFSHTAGMMMATGAVMGLAEGQKEKNQDPDLSLPRFAAKSLLSGMLL